MLQFVTFANVAKFICSFCSKCNTASFLVKTIHEKQCSCRHVNFFEQKQKTYISLPKNNGFTMIIVETQNATDSFITAYY